LKQFNTNYFLDRGNPYIVSSLDIFLEIVFFAGIWISFSTKSLFILTFLMKLINQSQNFPSLKWLCFKQYWEDIKCKNRKISTFLLKNTKRQNITWKEKEPCHTWGFALLMNLLFITLSKSFCMRALSDFYALIHNLNTLLT